jgi:hypothetical protein
VFVCCSWFSLTFAGSSLECVKYLFSYTHHSRCVTTLLTAQSDSVYLCRKIPTRLRVSRAFCRWDLVSKTERISDAVVGLPYQRSWVRIPAMTSAVLLNFLGFSLALPVKFLRSILTRRKVLGSNPGHEISCLNFLGFSLVLPNSCIVS